MRITNNMMIERMKRHINNNLIRMDTLQTHMATGKKINKASDDPVGSARVMRINTDMMNNSQFERNINDGLAWLEATEGSLEELVNVLQRAREMAVQGANGVMTPEDTQKMREELSQIIHNVAGIANSTHNGRYIFSGYKDDTPLVDAGNKQYQITVWPGEDMNYNIGSNDSININTLGINVFGAGVAGDVGQLFQDLLDFEGYLNTGDFGNISNLSIKAMDDHLENILAVRAAVGGKVTRLELIQSRMEKAEISLTKLLSNTQDVDIAETIMNLKNEENVYRSSLAAGARIIQPTLVDFLR